MSSNGCERVLVRGVNWIGDAVMTIPAIRAVRRGEPSLPLSLLVKPWVAPLFEEDPSVDDIILYSEAHRGIAGRIGLVRALRERRFCRAVLLQNAFDAALITALAGIPERIGYRRDGRGLLLSHAVPFDRRAANLHHIDYYLNLVAAAGYPSMRTEPWIRLLPEERLAARARLSTLRRPVIGMNPGATYGSSKRWPPDRFGEVARMVMEELGGSVALFGGPAETAIATEIVEAIGQDGEDRLLVAAGRTGLRELAALISECDALLTNDSGPMHIGYAVGTPLVAVFGSTSPELTGPPQGSGVVIRKPVECAPCFERECRRKDLVCMDLVTVDEVYDAVKSLCGRRRAVLFDRDGTLCRDAHYLRRMEDLEIFPSVRSLRRLKDAGFLLIGVSNQSGIARGIVQEDFVREVNDIFMRDFGFDAFYYCPHHPDDHCSCRKPEPGLLWRARTAFGLDLKSSYVVGDKEIDMQLAKAVGAKAIHVRTGQEEHVPGADHSAGTLDGVVEIVCGPA